MKSKNPAEKNESRKSKKSATSLPLCRLKEIREAQGISIVDLAEESGIHRNTIAQIEYGVREGNLSMHLKLIAALKVSTDEYFGFISSQPVEDKPIILDSEKGFRAENLPTVVGSIKRFQIPPGDVFSLDTYLDKQKPVFLYVAQGPLKIERSKQIHKLPSFSAMTFPRANNFQIRNLSDLSGVLLAFQS